MKRRLRSAVFVLVVVAQVATIAVMMISVFAFQTDAIRNQMALTLDRSAEASATSTEAEFEEAQGVVETAAELLSLELVEAGELKPTFISAMNKNPNLSALYIGTADGKFDFIGRYEDGLLHKQITPGRSLNNVTLASLTKDGDLISSQLVTEDYDPRQRPWYQLAEYDPTIAGWTDPYVFYTNQKLGITVSRAVVVDGKVVAVVGADIELAELSAMLAVESDNEVGGAVIFNDRGAVLAHSDPGVSSEIESSGMTAPVQVTQIKDPLTLASLAGLIEQGLANASVSEYRFQGHAGLSTNRTLSIGETEWFIVVYGTDDEIVPQLVSDRRNELYMALGLGVITLLVGAFAAYQATRPLELLQHEAATDSLTSLPNRRAILTAASVKLSSGVSGMALVDLDHFKLVNDTHGHSVGDEVLVELAERLRTSIRPEDIAGRLGGEEFLIMFDTNGPARLSDLSERVRRDICSRPFATSAGPLTVTASIGTCEGRPSDSITELLRHADAALYRAKESGRNRVAEIGLATELGRSGSFRKSSSNEESTI